MYVTDRAVPELVYILIVKYPYISFVELNGFYNSSLQIKCAVHVAMGDYANNL